MYLGNTKITELENSLSINDKKKNLKNIYDVINEIAKDLNLKGKDIKKYFLTENQYETIKKTSNNLI